MKFSADQYPMISEFIKGKTIKEIARDLKVSWTTVGTPLP